MIDPNTVEEAIAKAATVRRQEELTALRIRYLGRKGIMTEALKAVGSLPPEQRASRGAAANAARASIEAAFKQAERKLRERQLRDGVKELKIDLTAPGEQLRYGHAHPVAALIDDMVRVFWQMGFVVAEGPEIETEWYNFEALNMRADHPARDMQDTFYLEEGNLPRTHTSNVQIRYMEKHQPPIRIIVPGKAFRNEDEDARHSWMFHQLEGLVVDEGVSMSDLKGTLLAMLKGLLGESAKLRLRPNYFPYTEPSVEMDASCVICNSKGCNMCSGTGWLELGGAGMVHPQVLRNCGIDPERYSGFAFGFGPERIAAIRYEVPDVREFWRPNLKFLEQF
ncbi:MAG TPA: phenylalanine--tRNA ligase subunit alpha [Candidatus Saccharimonadales bacterium]|nr:phenylalanine--tRNA ligase subunit alpha [Candidatus Saccharimonadales bacterium]